MFRLHHASDSTCLKSACGKQWRMLAFSLLLCIGVDSARVSRSDAHRSTSLLHGSLRRERQLHNESSTDRDAGSFEATASSLGHVGHKLQYTAHFMLDLTSRLLNPMLDFAMRRFVSDTHDSKLKQNSTSADVIAVHQIESMQNDASAYAILMALGGGTGASMGTGTALGDRELLQRMHYQDKAVMLLILMVYMTALAFSARLTYRHASNNSPITYYSDPRYHSFAMEGNGLENFLETFNQAPRDVTLQVVGFVPVPDESGNSVHWKGQNYQVAFTFSLDLSPWVVRESYIAIGSPGNANVTQQLRDGTSPGDRDNLQKMLTNDRNDLSYVQLSKDVSWVGFEELATNIKHKIRQRGFSGIISVNRTETEEVRVYKNLPWANFLHARATRVLCALSMFGWMIYWPYMWARCRSVNVRSHFRVDVSISDYWSLIEDQLGPQGFQDGEDFLVLPRDAQ